MNPERLVETVLSGNNPMEHVTFNDKRIARRTPNGEINFYLADHLDSSRVGTDSAGNAVPP